MELIILHSTNKPINKFDINNFGINSLLNDTKQFGFYFLFCNDKDDEEFIKDLAANCARYGLRKVKENGGVPYMYIGNIIYYPENFIVCDSKISENEYNINFGNNPIFKNIDFNYYKNNVDLFYAITICLLQKYKDDEEKYKKVADFLIERGYDGFINGKEFGTVVIFNTDIIKLKFYAEYEKSNDFKYKDIKFKKIYSKEL